MPVIFTWPFDIEPGARGLEVAYKVLYHNCISSSIFIAFWFSVLLMALQLKNLFHSRVIEEASRLLDLKGSLGQRAGVGFRCQSSSQS